MEPNPYRPSRDIRVAPTGNIGSPRAPFGATAILAIVLASTTFGIGLYGIWGCATLALKEPSQREFVLANEIALTVMWLLFGMTFFMAARYCNTALGVLLFAAPFVVLGILVLYF